MPHRFHTLRAQLMPTRGGKVPPVVPILHGLPQLPVEVVAPAHQIFDRFPLRAADTRTRLAPSLDHRENKSPSTGGED